ncbi:MAG: TIGR04283 family arsenosugar biosynthesis glycosyltransferase [Rhodospirillaceae bacterium]
MQLSVIIPCLNEAHQIVELLQSLQPLRARGAEVIVVDGGSKDGTLEAARSLADHVVAAPRGRAAQMNAGAAMATREVLLFLHADTRLPDEADRLVLDALKASGKRWGRFDVRITGRHPMLPIIAAAMNVRSRCTGIATGDQAIFVVRDAFDDIGRYADIPLMEDIDLTKRLKRRGAPLCLTARVTTSGRRWQRHGVFRTILLMWHLRLAYALGADPRALATRYAPHGR